MSCLHYLMVVRGYLNTNQTLKIVFSSPGKQAREIKDQRKNRGHPDYSTVKIDQNTEKGLGDLR